MANALWVCIEGLPDERYLARKWEKIPKHEELAFKAIPPDLTSMILSTPLFSNAADGRREEVNLDYAQAWGLNDEDNLELVFAQAKCAATSNRFCLRMIFNAEQATSDVRSKRYRVYNNLMNDAVFHAAHLASIEGLYVPRHYGMWIMDTGKWAGKVLFSLNQWCGVSWRELSFTKFNTEANKVLIGRSFEALHDLGIDHGGLRNREDLRHALIDVDAPGLSQADLLNGRARCYIVDFSDAHANHLCTRKLPILPHHTFLWNTPVGCAEISGALFLFGFVQCPNAETSASEALEWHTEYSKSHPNMKNSDILMAQRENDDEKTVSTSNSDDGVPTAGTDSSRRSGAA
ncbi:hypothetical protein B0H15DRAFT_125628 [Mycena belliarum]|uniref:Protein kinase domain-containing protein n=1 Tax=Mycena belliarum TaxID=1033014 RepID=A0AAD6UD11_9AGAR|nr:hypothetical protein B0H15DRAFT_125628 [Mycena belliae]